MWQPVLTRNLHLPNSEKIATYFDHGGYQAVRKALTLTPDEIIDIVKRARLRGRGGAGFPTGLKWSFVPKGAEVTRYLAVNTDEGEPGTFKDRAIVERDPHQIIEGVIIAAYAIQAQRAFVYIRGEFFLGVKRWIKAIADAYEYGLLGKNILHSGFNLDISVHRGAGAYICGEETAMIESLEGRRGEPRLKPPYPVQAGLWGQPTVVQNVETLVNVPHIVLNGAEWYAAIGTEKSAGPKIFCISGHVNRPGVYELPLGTPLRAIIDDYAGGVRHGHTIKAVIPGGISTNVVLPAQLDVPMSFEGLEAIGTQLGTGGIVVMDDTTDMVEVARRTVAFFTHESCGSCVPCRLGGYRLLETLTRFTERSATADDMQNLQWLARGISGITFCPLGAGMANPVNALVHHFGDEFRAHMQVN